MESIKFLVVNEFLNKEVCILDLSKEKNNVQVLDEEEFKFIPLPLNADIEKVMEYLKTRSYKRDINHVIEKGGRKGIDHLVFKLIE